MATVIGWRCSSHVRGSSRPVDRQPAGESSVSISSSVNFFDEQFTKLGRSIGREYRHFYDRIRANVGEFGELESGTNDKMAEVATRLVQSQGENYIPALVDRPFSRWQPRRTIQDKATVLGAFRGSLREREGSDIAGFVLSQVPRLKYEYVERFLHLVDIPVAAVAGALSLKNGMSAQASFFHSFDGGQKLKLTASFAKRPWVVDRYQLNAQLLLPRLTLSMGAFQNQYVRPENDIHARHDRPWLVGDASTLAARERGVMAEANIGSFHFRGQASKAVDGDSGSWIGRAEVGEAIALSPAANLSAALAINRTRIIGPDDVRSRPVPSGSASVTLTDALSEGLLLISGASAEMGSNCLPHANAYAGLHDLKRQISAVLSFDCYADVNRLFLNIQGEISPQVEDRQKDLMLAVSYLREALYVYDHLPDERQASADKVPQLKMNRKNVQESVRVFFVRLEESRRQLSKLGQPRPIDLTDEEMEKARAVVAKKE